MEKPNSIVVTVFVASGFDRSAAGLAGAGQRLARELGARHMVLACAAEGSPAAEKLARVADEAHLLRSPDLEAGQSEAWLSAIESFANIQKPAAVLLGSDTLSQELTPSLAQRLGGASVGDAQKLSVQDGKIRVVRSVYGGKAMAVVELQRAPAVIWVRSRSMEPAGEGEAGKVRVVESGAPAKLKLRMIERLAEDAQGERLEDASLIVSGGRGVGGPEHFEQLKELASVMKAQMAASRAACDSGWAPCSWQVGQTGKKVAPSLYLAIALSGTSQHLMGITGARAIAAINTDPDAPIFKHCRFGIVADFRKVVGPLKEKLAARLT